MKKNLRNSIFVSIVLLLILMGCRQDIMLQNEETFDASAAKFKVVKMKDIPQVGDFIQNKTGRNDNLLPLKIGSQNINAKGAINFENLETSLIIEKSEGNDTFYTFDITNAGDDKTFYNLEVKEVNGTVVDAKVIEYASNINYGSNPINVLSNLTGTVKAYALSGGLLGGISYTYGEGPCDDTPNPPGNGTPGGGGSGGGEGPPSGGNPGGDPFNPLPPGSGNPGSGGGGGDDGGNTTTPNDGCDPTVIVSSLFLGTIPGGGGGFYEFTDDCGGKSYGTIKSVMAISASKLKPGCDDDGSGTVILPEASIRFSQFINTLPTNLQLVINNANNSAFFTLLSTYFYNNGETQTAKDFISWAVQFINDNPNVTVAQFQDWFIDENGTANITFNSTLLSSNSIVMTKQEFTNYLNEVNQLSINIQDGTTTKIKYGIKGVFGGINVFLNHDKLNNKFIGSSINTSEYGFTLTWSWSQTNSSIDTSNSTFNQFDLFGTVNSNFIIDGIGTIYKSPFHIRFKTNKNDGDCFYYNEIK